ncbi:MAG: carboxypeptidase regulatory-like domain-containing protein [Gemmatimonadaceae bacterium]|nr:carboxypeptidase regulatory-like domain-containing protein [Gemmatimonadaceae bacterium]
MRRLAIVLALCAVCAAVPALWAQGPTGPLATIAGSVFDSLSLRPMAGAVVQLARLGGGGRVEDTRSTATDSAGRYAFETIPLGSYLLGFQHLALDTLGLRTPVHRVDVRRAGTVRVALAAPTMQSVVASVCGEQTRRDSVALLVGSVRDAEAGGAVRDAFVSVRWSEVFLTRAGIVRETPRHDLRSRDDGWYVACVPSSVPVTIHAELDASRSGDVELRVSLHTVQRRDLYIGRATVAIVTADDSVRTSGAVNAGDRIVASGKGVIRGLVRRLDGRPLPDARVGLAGTRAEARTDSGGRFVLRALPEGSRMVEVRALGFMPSETLVDVVGFEDTPVSITMLDVESVLLDTVRVRAARRMTEVMRAGFERRRKSGTGTFLDERLLDTLRANTFSDIARHVTGIIFREGRGMNDAFERQMFFSGGGRSEPCQPMIYVDGIRLVQGITDVDQLVDPTTIRRVEVYLRGTTPPAEFASFAECGILALWTGPRLRR